jgi:hypothetical protein
MPLDAQVVAALIDLRVAELRVLAAETFVQRRTDVGCFPPPVPARRPVALDRNLPRPWVRPGGGGRLS